VTLRDHEPLCRRQSCASPDQPQTLSAILILVSSNAAKHRLPEQPGQGVPAILPHAGIGQDIARHHAHHRGRDEQAAPHRRSPLNREIEASRGGQNRA
jgi:hypothetical protein